MIVTLFKMWVPEFEASLTSSNNLDPVRTNEKLRKPFLVALQGPLQHPEINWF
jgi:hypothetical protein